MPAPKRFALTIPRIGRALFRASALIALAAASDRAHAGDKILGYSTLDSSDSHPRLAFFLDGSLGVRVRGYNHASVASIPKSHGLSLQGRFGLKLWDTLVLGVSPEYQYLQQFDKNGAFVGNWSGSETTLLKGIFGFHFNHFQILAGYGLNPNLALSQKTSTGQTLSYKDGYNAQAEIDFKCSEKENITLHYSFGSFDQQVLDGVTSTLTYAVKWTAFGIGYTRNFF